MPVRIVWRPLKVILIAAAFVGIVGLLRLDRFTLDATKGLEGRSSGETDPLQHADGQAVARERGLHQNESSVALSKAQSVEAEERWPTATVKLGENATRPAVWPPASMSIVRKTNPSRLFRSPGALPGSPMPECLAEPWPESFIDAVIYVRLQSQDINHNVLRWIQWAWWSGVRKVYLFDTAIKPTDRKLITLPGIPELIDSGLVILVDYPLVAKGVPAFCSKQVELVQEANACWPTLGWRHYIDFDEFLFKPADTAQDWLQRYIHTLHPKVAVVLLCNVLFGGQKVAPDSDTPMPQGLGKIKSRPEIYYYRKPFSLSKTDSHTKVLGRPRNISYVDVHTASPAPGYTAMKAQCEEIRFNHYWGPRVGYMKGMVYDQSMELPLLSARKAFQAEFGIF